MITANEARAYTEYTLSDFPTDHDQLNKTIIDAAKAGDEVISVRLNDFKALQYQSVVDEITNLGYSILVANGIVDISWSTP